MSGVVLLHGFTGSPFEMSLLGEDLRARGFRTLAPPLAGHVGSTRDLARTTWHDWYDSASRAVDELSDEGRGRGRVGVVGLSMGGLLTLELCRRRGDEIAAACVLAAPLWLPRAAELLARAPFLQWLALPKIAGSDIRDREMKRRNEEAQGRAAMPVRALRSLVELAAHVRAHLGEVRTPTLLMHSTQDHTAPYACMDAVAAGLGTSEQEKVTLHESFHVLTLDVERDRVFTRVADWLGTH